MKRGETLADVILWACPWCHKSAAAITEHEDGWQVECKVCHTSGPLGDNRRNSVKGWNCLAQRIQLARATCNASG